jgi:hypothetical protein
MGSIVARLKSKKKLQKIQNNVENNIFDMADVNYAGAVIYDGSLTHHEDWLKFSFTDEHYLFKAINTATLSSVSHDDIFEIQMFAFYDTGVFYFQKVRAGNKILKKHFTIKLDKIKVEEPSKIISINCLPDGIYDTKNKTLYFKKVSDVSFLFPELNKEYKTATDTEIDNFISLSGINTTAEIDKSRLTVVDRKRISAVVAELQGLKMQEREQLNDYIKNELGDKVPYNDTQHVFEISNENELRTLTYGYQHRIYSTPFDHEPQVAIERTGVSRILGIAP